MKIINLMKIFLENLHPKPKSQTPPPNHDKEGKAAKENPTNHINKDNYFVIKMEIVFVDCWMGRARNLWSRDEEGKPN
jgi:hypothetical protein